MNEAGRGERGQDPDLKDGAGNVEGKWLEIPGQLRGLLKASPLRHSAHSGSSLSPATSPAPPVSLLPLLLPKLGPTRPHLPPRLCSLGV